MFSGLHEREVSDGSPYNPLDKKNLGASVAEALLEQPVHPLGKVKPFRGAGIYAIYYVGDFPAYMPLVARNRGNKFEVPIYVGKAVPAGARKGGFGLDAEPGHVLYGRLSEHAESIELARNLELKDFFCRYLVVDDIWIPLGESLLIVTFAPVWNKVVDGFGNHDPGSGRYSGMRPLWDVLHPGRGWAAKCQPRPETSAQISERLKAYLKAIQVSPKPKLLARDE